MTAETIAVLTCAIGLTDPVRPPTRINPAVRYVCVTDRPAVPRPYVRVAMVTPAPANRGIELAARRIKILLDEPALGAAGIVVWHDAAFQLTTDPLEIVTAGLAGGADFAAFRHPHRDRIEDEAAAIARLGYMSADVLAVQVAAYRGAGFTGATITSSGLSVRRLTPAVRAFNALWWAEVAMYGWRDQMAIDYARWRAGLAVSYLPGHYKANPYARWYPTCAR